MTFPYYYGKIIQMFQSTNQWKIDHGCHGFLWSLGLFGPEIKRSGKWNLSETISNENGEIANKNMEY